MSEKEQPIRMAMLGMIEGNGHPYSWSAIVNGFDAEALRRCPYPVIYDYMSARARDSVGISGARVTHVWTDRAEEAESVAAAALIPNVASRPEDVIGQVDAVLIATDDGDDHIRRVRPFVEAGLPVFVDKPLATNLADLRQFCRWVEGGARITSSSGLRYAPEMIDAAARLGELGQLRWVTSLTCKTWERYGIHALEAVAPLLGSGFTDVSLRAEGGRQIATICHASGVMLSIGVLDDAYGSFGAISLHGTADTRNIRMRDTYTAFRNQLLGFVDYVRGAPPAVLFEETVELMLVLLAGMRSRERDGAPVRIDDLRRELRGDVSQPSSAGVVPRC